MSNVREVLKVVEQEWGTTHALVRTAVTQNGDERAVPELDALSCTLAYHVQKTPRVVSVEVREISERRLTVRAVTTDGDVDLHFTKIV